MFVIRVAPPIPINTRKMRYAATTSGKAMIPKIPATNETMPKERTIERTMEFEASPERVWRAITDPVELSKWFGHETDLELVPGYEGAMTWEQHGRYALRVDVVGLGINVAKYDFQPIPTHRMWGGDVRK